VKRNWVVAVVAALGLALVPASGIAGSPPHPAAVAAKTCSASYTHAVIGGAQKCLRRGEYCAVAYRSTYRRYGFTCSGSPARLH
jgi:hypothetical protein